MRLLKPCPICRHAGVRRQTGEGLWYVRCELCRHKTKSYKEVHFAVTAWNKRKGEFKKVCLECGEHGRGVVSGYWQVSQSKCEKNETRLFQKVPNDLYGCLKKVPNDLYGRFQSRIRKDEKNADKQGI